MIKQIWELLDNGASWKLRSCKILMACIMGNWEPLKSPKSALLETVTFGADWFVWQWWTGAGAYQANGVSCLFLLGNISECGVIYNFHELI